MAERIELKDCDALFLVFGDLGKLEEGAYVCTGVMMHGAIEQGDILACISLDEPGPGEPLAGAGTVVTRQAVFGGARPGGKGAIQERLTFTPEAPLPCEALFMMAFPEGRRVPRLAMARIRGADNVIDRASMLSALARKSADPFFILIAGMSCSGKTTLAKQLCRDMERDAPLLLCQDSWFRDLPDIPRGPNGYRNMESPEAFHTAEFIEAVRRLSTGQEAQIPIYDVKANRRTGMSVKQSRPLVIVEGLHSIMLLSDLLAHKYTIFVNTPFELCRQRRIERDSALLGIDGELVKKHFTQVVYPFYEPYIRPQADMAEIKTYNTDGEQTWN